MMVLCDYYPENGKVVAVAAVAFMTDARCHRASRARDAGRRHTHILAAPSISAAFPANLPFGGALITVLGSNFGGVPGAVVAASGEGVDARTTWLSDSQAHATHCSLSFRFKVPVPGCV